jgi:hypothetical protein
MYGEAVKGIEQGDEQAEDFFIKWLHSGKTESKYEPTSSRAPSRCWPASTIAWSWSSWDDMLVVYEAERNCGSTVRKPGRLSLLSPFHEVPGPID